MGWPKGAPAGGQEAENPPSPGERHLMTGHLSATDVVRSVIIGTYLTALVIAGHRAPSTAVLVVSLVVVWAVPTLRPAARACSLATSPDGA